MNENPEKVKKKYKVIIIGAGMAGISAAHHLIKNGFYDFKILEARNRIGGRIISIEMGAQRIELGANWIHGVLGNPMFEIAMSHGLVNIINIPKPHKIVAATEDGKQVPFEILQEIYEAYVCFLKRCEEYFLCQYCPPPDINSVGEHINLETELYLDGVDDKNEKHLKQLIFNCLMKRETCISGCDNMNEIDLLELGSYTELQGGNITLPSGYSSIMTPLCHGIPNGTIVKGCPVKTIHWKRKTKKIYQCGGLESVSEVVEEEEDEQDDDDDDDDDDDSDPASDDSEKTVTEILVVGDENDNNNNDKVKDVTITKNPITGDHSQPKKKVNDDDADDEDIDAIIKIVCEDGTCYYADHVITTVPLGVLKEKAKQLFHPHLPQYKLESIERLLYGTVDKIFLEYDRPFLNADISEVMLLWEPILLADDEIKLTNKYLQQNWFKKIYSFSKISDTLLLGWISGREAEYMETLTHDVVAEKCTEILRKFLKDPYVPKPKRCVCTSWHKQPYSRGSYTAIAVGASQEDIENISQPLYSSPRQSKPSVLFAGEHTHVNFYSTVHGAYLSGRTAAQIILTPDSPREIVMESDSSDLSSWIQGISLD